MRINPNWNCIFFEDLINTEQYSYEAPYFEKIESDYFSLASFFSFCQERWPLIFFLEFSPKNISILGQNCFTDFCTWVFRTKRRFIVFFIPECRKIVNWTFYDLTNFNSDFWEIYIINISLNRFLSQLITS